MDTISLDNIELKNLLDDIIETLRVLHKISKNNQSIYNKIIIKLENEDKKYYIDDIIDFHSSMLGVLRYKKNKKVNLSISHKKDFVINSDVFLKFEKIRELVKNY
jgi:phosphopantetheinyl transferase (holo-ACP synthase)